MAGKEKVIDLAIIGAGPAGLTSAIYATRAKLNSIVIEDELVGGQILGTYTIENYPGFENISGADLAQKLRTHAEKLGAEIDEFGKIKSITLKEDEKIIETTTATYMPKSVIIATGAKSRPLPIPEEEKLHGKSIHYCELCDGALYENKDLIVVGGGNSAVEAALFLRKYAKSITFVHQFDYLQATKANQEEVFKDKNIKFIWDTEIRHVYGEDRIESIVVENVKSHETSELKADGIFAYIGYIPKTELFKESIKTNQWGYIEAGEDTKTNVKGVFAAGDVRSKEIRQITTAISDGTIAALMAEKYILGRDK